MRLAQLPVKIGSCMATVGNIDAGTSYDKAITLTESKA